MTPCLTLCHLQGLTYTSARELLGHEALAQADLLLKLAAGECSHSHCHKCVKSVTVKFDKEV
jgi:hypothetical protein